MNRTLRTGEFHGVRRDTARLSGLTLAETTYEPGHRLPYHAHERPFFSLLVRGDFREEHDRGVRHCVPASLVFYPEHEPHREVFGASGGLGFHVEVGSEWMLRMRDEGWCYSPGSTESVGARLNALMVRLHASFTGGATGLEAEEIVLEMLSCVTRTDDLGSEASPPAWLARMRDRLHAGYRGTVRVTELAAEAGVHPVHAGRVFRRHHGMTIARYVRALRIEDARRALLEGQRSLSAIAVATGFADQAHFSRHFKEVVGVPPGRYRKLVRA